VRGIDLLGHPFEERTATLALNLHGCRYSSKHHLPRNSWITIELGAAEARRNVRARVAWIHRPHSIREFFQVAVELEEASNIWGLESAPQGWPAPPPPGPLVEANWSQAIHEDVGESRHASYEQTAQMEGQLRSMTSHSSETTQGNQAAADIEDATAVWRDRISSEMMIAQQQWNELLQSSIDRALQRLAEQLPERARESVRLAEEKMTEHFTNLSQLLSQVSSEAQNTLTGVKSLIDQELWRARDTLENSRQQVLEGVAADAEARVAPFASRVPELVRELSSREEQMSEALRLHRERLRQTSESTLREVSSQIEATAVVARDNFEAARVEALGKWTEEIDAASARAGHSASEAIGRSSEWFQQETRQRLQTLVEQTLAGAAANLEEETAKAAGQFGVQLEGQSLFYLAHLHQQMDGVAGDLAGKARTQLAEAAEVAAASFGQVIHNVSEERTRQFDQTSQQALDRKTLQMESAARDLQRNFETQSASALESLRSQATEQVESAVARARTALAGESAAAFQAYRTERENYLNQWTQDLNRAVTEAAEQCTARIQTAADTWTVASVRRLNEHGQGIIESLTRSADQALRDSASKIFENLASAIRSVGTGLAAPETHGAQAAAANLSPNGGSETTLPPS